jgi:hypothetical protein
MMLHPKAESRRPPGTEARTGAGRPVPGHFRTIPESGGQIFVAAQTQEAFCVMSGFSAIAMRPLMAAESVYLGDLLAKAAEVPMRLFA